MKEFVVTWFRPDGFRCHAGESLAFALMILLVFALCIALLRLAFGLLKRKRHTIESEDEREREYWRIHGG